MRRTACIDLPAFPLQLLLRQQLDWKTHPVAVVDADKPQGILLWVNEKARASRILPGMRYAAALSLARDLRAAEVSSKTIQDETAAMSRRLRLFTPHVEPASGDEPGVFWLDATGLERIHGSLSNWAALLRSDLKRQGFISGLAVGFSRFGTYAVSRSKRSAIVFRTLAEERAAARRVPLDRLNLETKTRDALHKLGIDDVGRFVDLPAAGIERRYGPQAYRLHRLASGELRLPLQPEKPLPPPMKRLLLDHAERDVPRLMAAIERLIDPLLGMLRERNQLLTEIRVGFRFERMGDHLETIRPAAPTLDVKQLIDLIRLRLQAIRKLPDGVDELVLAASGTAVAPGQLRLLGKRPKRDLAAANRALARVRAELGDGAVLRARLREGHLPEASFSWEPLKQLTRSAPRRDERGALVRRIYARPILLPSRPRQEPDGWMLRGLDQGPVVRTLGPYIVAGGWWQRAVHREYHFAETQKGQLFWIFYDRGRRRWFLQGRVE